MSRSVQLDFDKLRNPQAVYLRQGEVVTFIGTTIPMTEEQVFGHRSYVDGRYRRTTEPYNVSPTNEDWAKYHQAKKGLLQLQAYAGTIGAEDIEIPCPKPETKHRYTETHEAWLERCRVLEAETEQEAALPAHLELWIEQTPGGWEKVAA